MIQIGELTDEQQAAEWRKRSKEELVQKLVQITGLLREYLPVSAGCGNHVWVDDNSRTVSQKACAICGQAHP